MSESQSWRRFAQVFDGVAEDYDAARLGYPDAIVGRAAERGGLSAGSPVLEVGCGTGKLTELLAARGYELTAVDPGERMLEVARRRVGADGARVRFVLGRFEDAELPEEHFDALFSATAWHWPDPAVSWRKAASLLRPGGVLALLTHVDDRTDETAAIEHGVRELLARYTPEAPPWGEPRSLADVVAGAEARAANASAVWDFVTWERHALAVDEAGDLFADVEIAVESERRVQTAEEAVAVLQTTSLWFSIDAGRRGAFAEDYGRLFEPFGGRLELLIATVLMTARRA